MHDTYVKIRPATPSDCERLVPLINTAFAVETFMAVPRTDTERLIESMAKGTVLMAEDRQGRALASIYIESRGSRGYMGMLAVDPEHQRSGLGSRMIHEAQEYLLNDSCIAVDITVLSLRPELMPFYRKMGFIQTGTEEFNPYVLKEGVRCHAIVMSKWLEDRSDVEHNI
jgi:ribosomal protein S18 acetylase RimI-like enzyme